MVDNTVVRTGSPYAPTSAVALAKDSALQAVHHLLQPLPALSLPHRRELLSIALWKWTEASGIAPYAKFNLRYVSDGARNTAVISRINHEHVWPRKWIIDRLVAGSRTWEASDLRAFLDQYGVACVVTVGEHARLSGIRSEEGWERYAAAGVGVFDLQEQGPFDLPQIDATAVDVERDPASEGGGGDGDSLPQAASMPESDQIADVIAAAAESRAGLLTRFVRSAELAGAAAAVAASNNPQKPVGDYLRIHDTVIEEPTRAAAYLHWNGRLSLGLTADAVPAWLVSEPSVAVQRHATYGVRCRLTDDASLLVGLDLLQLALQRLRSNAMAEV